VTARRSPQSVVNIRPMTIACQSHSASSFVHSKIWWLGEMQCIVQSIGVNQDLYKFRDTRPSKLDYVNILEP